MVTRVNPLIKRLPREFLGNIGKYAAIAILMILMIGEVSGFVVADHSMISAYNASYDVYNMEDGHFAVQSKLSRNKKEKIEGLGVEVYDLFYKDEKIESGQTLRFYKNRTNVDYPCVMKGELASEPGQIAIDRMFADNNRLDVGDEIIFRDRKFKISGLIALPDYSALFEKNSDMMFDANMFSVALISSDEFDSLLPDLSAYNYAWKYDTPYKSENREKDMSEDFLKELTAIVKLEDYLPRFSNQAITFTGEDMGSDMAMIKIFLYIVIAILAFVFTITISNTIQAESEVIGTLRASGYSRWELVWHYMTVPLVVTFVSAVIGNIAGYTVLKDANAAMYYGSYSLPTYVTLWSPEAFIQTTVIPIVIMMVVTFTSLAWKLRHTPLEFLRRDLSHNNKKRALHLPGFIPFFSRFRLRVIFQNVSSYVVLVLGIMFSYLLLMFGLAFPEIMHRYSDQVEDNMFSQYQYILTIPVGAVDENEKLSSMIEMLRFQKDVETDTPGAEKFSAYTLKTVEQEGFVTESITLYGIRGNSAYVPLNIKKDEVYISKAYADKFDIAPGDTITLCEEYEDDTYDFTVSGIYDHMGSISLFMRQADMNEKLDLGSGYFSGYFSDEAIEDIDEKYIGTVIDKEAMTKVSRQLLTSMGSLMYIVDVFSVIIFVVVIYLLSKMIIEKNAVSISMAKILGYYPSEIMKLYVLATCAVVVVALIALIPLEEFALIKIFKIMIRAEMHGWFELYIPFKIKVWMFATGIISYLSVVILELSRIRRIPMDEALKMDE